MMVGYDPAAADCRVLAPVRSSLAKLPSSLAFRITAANARRHEQHRHETEQKAMEQISPTETETAWKELSPLLDEAMVALAAKDRDAVALRFFEQKSFKEIGAALSLSEDNARKRVSRAVDRT